jgi:hypothetical protein
MVVTPVSPHTSDAPQFSSDLRTRSSGSAEPRFSQMAIRGYRPHPIERGSQLRYLGVLCCRLPGQGRLHLR